MNKPDHSTYREWLNLDADGRLAGEQSTRLEEHLAACAECRREREELAALEGLLRRSAIAMRPGFRASVMSSLPAAGWEGRAPRAWRFPAAACVLLGIAAVLLVAGSASAPSGFTALLAVGGMVRAAALAGAGLLAASWQGIGLVIDEVISSPVSLGAFGFLVLCLNLLLVSLIRRRRPAGARKAGN
jgi:predicted anti-sigma-YlaC factor YlaD